MEGFGFWSVLPPILAIFLAIRTKKVYIALLFGIWLGWVIINKGNPLKGTISTVQALVDVFKNEGSTQTIMFSALVGALIAFVQRSGGTEGFVRAIDRILINFEKKKAGNNRFVVQLFALLTGLILFVESSISALTVGSLYRPIFDKLKISREKLAYIADSSSSPSSILIPFNAWGAFIMGLLIAQGFDKPLGVMLKSMPLNFYPILAILMVFLAITLKLNPGPMKKAEKRTLEEGKVLNDGAKPMMSSEITFMQTKEGVKPRAFNMLVPMIVMVGMMPVMLIFTGWDKIDPNVTYTLSDKIFYAIGQGSGAASVLYSVITSLLVAAVMYRVQNIMRTGDIIDLALKGISGLLPLALLMLMAFAISNVCNSLGTGIYVAEVSKSWLSPGLVPVIVFIVSSFIAFSTGTSWGTFAIMISISVPMAQGFDSNIYLTIAAALGGGVFGDHCSPISDTTIISSMASATDHIDHVKTQLPYALFVGLITAGLYLILGFIL